MSMYVIRCRFQIKQGSEVVEGFALCSDPDTPTTFIYPDRTPYIGEDIWNYKLIHYEPWMKFE